MRRVAAIALLIPSLLFAGVLMTPVSQAETTHVNIADFAFLPSSVPIVRENTIEWTNIGAVGHTITSDTGYWDSGVISPTESFSFLFTSVVGSFAYHCTIHPNMTGTIIVQALPTATTTSTRTHTPTSTATRTVTVTPSRTATTTPKPPRAYLPLLFNPATPLPTATKTPAPTHTATATATSTSTATATSSPTMGPPTSTPKLPPPSYNDCQADPNPGSAPNYPVDIVTINKQAETVTLRNVTTGDTIDLSNWQMCSITGNQHHPIFGTLAPGQTRTFSGPAGNIWNNSSPDPGALYNSAGQLVSYYFD